METVTLIRVATGRLLTVQTLSKQFRVSGETLMEMDLETMQVGTMGMTVLT